MKRMHFDVTARCSQCGHSGIIYLEGKEAQVYWCAITGHWLRNGGLKLFTTTAVVGAVLGFLFGAWKP